jgi:regulator of cell morphogenesis and NO signaling
MHLIEQPLGQIAREIPGATAVLHGLKLDFCCGGDRTLKDAATRKGLDPQAIADQLAALQPDDSLNPAALADDRLVEYILARFHDAHREQLPELIRLAQRVERVHAGHPDCPAGLSAHLERMLQELEGHMQKEEQILFPMICRGMGSMATGPVSVMRHEHVDHGIALEKIGQLTQDITPPQGACNTWMALYRGLQALRDDLLNHIHIENNILFNRIDGRLGAA